MKQQPRNVFGVRAEHQSIVSCSSDASNNLTRRAAHRHKGRFNIRSLAFVSGVLTLFAASPVAADDNPCTACIRDRMSGMTAQALAVGAAGILGGGIAGNVPGMIIGGTVGLVGSFVATMISVAQCAPICAQFAASRRTATVPTTPPQPQPLTGPGQTYVPVRPPGIFVPSVQDNTYVMPLGPDGRGPFISIPPVGGTHPPPHGPTHQRSTGWQQGLGGQTGVQPGCTGSQCSTGQTQQSQTQGQRRYFSQTGQGTVSTRQSGQLARGPGLARTTQQQLKGPMASRTGTSAQRTTSLTRTKGVNRSRGLTSRGRYATSSTRSARSYVRSASRSYARTGYARGISRGNKVGSARSFARTPARSFGGGYRGGGIRRSDENLKHNIQLVSRLDSGLSLYRFNYRGSDQVFVGVMAQEVLRVKPEAVIRGADGYLRVDYEQLGLRMMTWQRWMAMSGAFRQAGFAGKVSYRH
jgi:hypothetical protein